jgi:hypothetical protein
MLVIIRDFSLPGNWKKNANVGQQTLIGTTNFEKKYLWFHNICTSIDADFQVESIDVQGYRFYCIG